MATSRYQRMVAIPEQEYYQSKNMQQVMHPLQSEMSSLMADYGQQSTIKDPHRKIHLQAETLDQMVKLKDDLRQSVKDATPRPYQSRADGLMSFVSDRMEFNKKGELTDIAGNIIENTNIIDLIQHAVRDRRRNITPPGWEYFLDKLKEINAPRMLLNYETLEEMSGSPSKQKLSDSRSSKRKVQESLFEFSKSNVMKTSPSKKSRKRFKAELLSDTDDTSFSAPESTTPSPKTYLPIGVRKAKRVTKRPSKYL